MGLRRSDSAKTTLSMVMSRSTRYLRWLTVANVIMLLGGLSLVFLGLVFKLVYYMDQVGFVSKRFVVLPWLLLGVGLISFSIAAAGFLMSASEERRFIIPYAIILVIVVVLQFATVFSAMFTRTDIEASVFDTSTDVFKDYDYDEGVRAQWDYLQYRLRCCGARRYNDYRSVRKVSDVKCVPDSCCFDFNLYGNSTNFGSISSTFESGVSSCATSISFNRKLNVCAQEATLVLHIYMRGCLDILDKMYKDDLLDLLVVYSLFGTFLALTQMVAVALAFAYSAQIRRKARKDEWNNAGAGNTGLEMDAH
jgi:hypothetical protein